MLNSLPPLKLKVLVKLSESCEAFYKFGLEQNFTFIKATLDLIFFFSISGLSLLPQALVTWVTDLKAVKDFFFFSLSLSRGGPTTESPLFERPSCKIKYD